MIPLGIERDKLRDIYERLDGIVLPGGGDVDPVHYGAELHPYTAGIHAERDDVETQLVRWAVEDDRPLLAICRGIQVLNVALGGTLIQDIRSDVEDALRHDAPSVDWFPRLVHDVMVEPGSKLHAALGVDGTRLRVNSLHHQAVEQVAPRLEIAARADDGIVEGVEMPDRRFILGVQWHPETLVDEHPPMKKLFEALVEAARG
jgi:putative glutamine amidotransferase